MKAWQIWFLHSAVAVEVPPHQQSAHYSGVRRPPLRRDEGVRGVGRGSVATEILGSRAAPFRSTAMGRCTIHRLRDTSRVDGYIVHVSINAMVRVRPSNNLHVDGGPVETPSLVFQSFANLDTSLLGRNPEHVVCKEIRSVYRL